MYSKDESVRALSDKFVINPFNPFKTCTEWEAYIDLLPFTKINLNQLYSNRILPV